MVTMVYTQIFQRCKRISVGQPGKGPRTIKTTGTLSSVTRRLQNEPHSRGLLDVRVPKPGRLNIFMSA